MSVEPNAYYQLESGDVVQTVAEHRGKVVLCDPSTGEVFGVRGEPFREQVREGYVQRVEPNWRPVSDG